MDGFSNSKGNGSKLLLKSGHNLTLEVIVGSSSQRLTTRKSMRLFLEKLCIILEMGVGEVVAKSNLQLITSQLKGDYQTKDSFQQQYLEIVKAVMA